MAAQPGVVYLVGAGPGDPGLMTVRGAELVASADVILHDRLIPKAALRGAREEAELVYVGKRPGASEISQSEIEGTMVERARAGQSVVRLKGGDPFVFGRGGEEALALATAGIPCEVVPGVSAAVAAPALSGIPVTHRGLSAAFLVVSGHSESAFAPVLGSLEPGTVSVVVLMGLQNRGLVAARLLSRGWRAETPAAVLLGAGTANARTWRGTLAALGRCELPDLHPDLPGVLVVGATVAVGRRLEELGAPGRLQAASGASG
jgi:uroporphyrin-III C-methyltransferase / precorrin-2 dehydrogenase / sirohydrochlorin ferrochelatase